MQVLIVDLDATCHHWKTIKSRAVERLIF